MVAVEEPVDPGVGGDAPVLNRFGLQVGLRLASKARQRMTRWPIPLELDSPLTGLRTEGCALLPRMFSPATLAEITGVAERVDRADEVPHLVDATAETRTEVTRREDLSDGDREVLDRFWLHPTVVALLSAAERRHLDPGALRCTVQRVADLADGDGAPLIQSDVAQPTHAMWLFLGDVFESDGPLVYYPGSQRLRPRQLRDVYAESLAGTEARVVTADELARRKLEPKVFRCAKGSAVLANTFGYHGWLPAEPAGDRLVLHVEVARRGRSDARPAGLGLVDADGTADEGSFDEEPAEAELTDTDLVLVDTDLVGAEPIEPEAPDDEPVDGLIADAELIADDDDGAPDLFEAEPDDAGPLDDEPVDGLVEHVQVTLFDQDLRDPVEAD